MQTAKGGKMSEKLHFKAKMGEKTQNPESFSIILLTLDDVKEKISNYPISH
jgi:hypothetical protein